jgi:large subunit ribosomal protein L18e
MKSKTLIEKQLRNKSNSEIVETIIAAKKKKAWLDVASILASSRKNHRNVNLNDLNKLKDGEKVVVPGKVLSQGDIDKKLKVVALGFSEKAKEKLLKSGSELSDILKEIKSNPEAKDVKIIK